MTSEESESIIEIAEQFWKRAEQFELGLLRKVCENLFFDDVKTVLEQCRLESKYSTLPLPMINERLKALHRKTKSQNYINCYALCPMTAKGLEVSVYANTNDGAKVEMEKYLRRFGLEPNDYIIYIGDANFDQYFTDRHEAKCILNPNLEVEVDKIRSLVSRGGSVVDSIAESLPEAKKQFVNTGVRVKEMTEAVLTKDYYDPDSPDEIPF